MTIRTIPEISRRKEINLSGRGNPAGLTRHRIRATIRRGTCEEVSEVRVNRAGAEAQDGLTAPIGAAGTGIAALQTVPVPAGRGRAEDFAVRESRIAEGAPDAHLTQAGAADLRIAALQAVPDTAEIPADPDRGEATEVQTLNAEIRQDFGGNRSAGIRSAPPGGKRTLAGVQVQADCPTESHRGSIWKMKYD